MKYLISSVLVIASVSTYAECRVDLYGRTVSDSGAPCVQNQNSYGSNTNNNNYRREENNLYGSSVNNYQDSYNSYDNGRTWNPTSPFARDRQQNSYENQRQQNSETHVGVSDSSTRIW